MLKLDAEFNLVNRGSREKGEGSIILRQAQDDRALEGGKQKTLNWICF